MVLPPATTTLLPKCQRLNEIQRKVRYMNFKDYMNKKDFKKILVPFCLGAYSLTLSWLHGTTTTLYTQACTAGPVHTVVQPKLQISPLLYTVKKWGCLLQTGTPDIASPIKGSPRHFFLLGI